MMMRDRRKGDGKKTPSVRKGVFSTFRLTKVEKRFDKLPRGGSHSPCF